MRSVIHVALAGVVTLAGLLLYPAERAEACSRGWAVYFTEPGSDVVTPRGEQVIDAFVEFYVDRRIEPPNGTGCGPLPPENLRVVLLSLTADGPLPDRCATAARRGSAVRRVLLDQGIPDASVTIEAFVTGKQYDPAESLSEQSYGRRVELLVLEGGPPREGGRQARSLVPRAQPCQGQVVW